VLTLSITVNCFILAAGGGFVPTAIPASKKIINQYDTDDGNTQLSPIPVDAYGTLQDFWDSSPAFV